MSRILLSRNRQKKYRTTSTGKHLSRGFITIQNNTNLKQISSKISTDIGFITIQNNTNLKLIDLEELVQLCFITIQNNTNLKPFH